MTHPMRFLNKEMDSLCNYDSSGMSYVKKYTILAEITFFDITIKKHETIKLNYMNNLNLNTQITKITGK
jgi:hypothetical protein